MMKQRALKISLVAVIALIFGASSAFALPMLEFDDISAHGGNITLSGTTLTGSNVYFDTLVVSEGGSTQYTIEAYLNFVADVSLNGDGTYSLASSGSYTIGGTVYGSGGGTLYSGDFLGGTLTYINGDDSSIRSRGYEDVDADFLAALGYTGVDTDGDGSVGYKFITTAITIGDAGQVKDADSYNTPVPEPATMLLLGFGLSGAAGINLRRKKKA